MIIHVIPIRSDRTMVASKHGDVLYINDVPYDFSPIQEGDVLPQGAIDYPLIQGEVTRVDGHIVLTLRKPHAYQPDPRELLSFDLIDPPDGDLVLRP